MSRRPRVAAIGWILSVLSHNCWIPAYGIIKLINVYGKGKLKPNLCICYGRRVIPCHINTKITWPSQISTKFGMISPKIVYAKFQLQRSIIVVIVVTSKVLFLRIFGRVHYTEVAKTQWVLETTIIWNSATLLPIKCSFKCHTFITKVKVSSPQEMTFDLEWAKKVLSISLNIYPNTNFVLSLSHLEIWSWDWEGMARYQQKRVNFQCVFHCCCQKLR